MLRQETRPLKQFYKEPSKVKFYNSNEKNKKYRVNFDYDGANFNIHFGDKRYQHFRDTTPLKIYKKLDNLDERRRKAFITRASGIKDINGKLTKDNPLHANYWSLRYLWSFRNPTKGETKTTTTKKVRK